MAGWKSPPCMPNMPVFERNRVAARRGGEQREKKESSVAIANSIRPDCLASLRTEGEARTCVNRKPMTLMLGIKAIMGDNQVVGDGRFRRPEA